MGRLREIQTEHFAWREHNFPGAEPWEALVGALEELGELAHAHLKGHWDIRGMRGITMNTKKMDAIGDTVIYLISYCNSHGFDFEAIVEETWAEVRERDWVMYPGKGRPEPLTNATGTDDPSV